jgi:hypothetical protein
MSGAIEAPQVLLAHHLKALKLPTFLREYAKVAAECAKGRADHPNFLLRLAELELLDRERRLVERRIRAAHFPAVKSFETFDFTAIPSLNKMLVLDLARCEYINAHDNIIALGNSGTGGAGEGSACAARGRPAEVRRMSPWLSAWRPASAASRSPHSPRPYPGDEWRKLPPETVQGPAPEEQ